MAIVGNATIWISVAILDLGRILFLVTLLRMTQPVHLRVEVPSECFYSTKNCAGVGFTIARSPIV